MRLEERYREREGRQMGEVGRKGGGEREGVREVEGKVVKERDGMREVGGKGKGSMGGWRKGCDREGRSERGLRKRRGKYWERLEER